MMAINDTEFILQDPVPHFSVQLSEKTDLMKMYIDRYTLSVQDLSAEGKESKAYKIFDDVENFDDLPPLED